MQIRIILCFALLSGCLEYQLDGAREVPEDGEATETDPDLGDGTTPDPDDDGTDPGNPEDTGEFGTTPGVPEAGCSDGQREGFESWDDYPDIAACSGGWSVGGVTDASPAVCGRISGDDSANGEGDGCAAVDLCMDGWHVCDGAVEVEALSIDGCAGAVPPGTPDKTLFFAVSQHSDNGSVCDDSSANANDVYGCGNLGVQLDAGKNCGVLDRVLASMNPNSCGFNEAEPNLGPWECVGGQNSHLAEGELVTKIGCPWDSCLYDGQPVGNSDKGGVVCCRD